MSRIRSVIRKFDRAGVSHATNKQIIAECIRRELAEARACDDTADEAEKRIATMLAKEFVNVRVVEPLRIADRSNFDEWTVTVRYPVGEPLLIDQNS